VGRRVAGADGGRVAYTRTRAEYVRTVAVAVALGVGLVAGFGTLAHVVSGALAGRLGFGLPVVGWGAVAGAAAVVGCGAAAAVGVFARPRVVLAGGGLGVGESAGHGDLWPGAAGAAERGDGGLGVEAVTA